MQPGFIRRRVQVLIEASQAGQLLFRSPYFTLGSAQLESTLGLFGHKGTCEAKKGANVTGRRGFFHLQDLSLEPLLLSLSGLSSKSLMRSSEAGVVSPRIKEASPSVPRPIAPLMIGLPHGFDTQSDLRLGPRHHSPLLPACRKEGTNLIQKTSVKLSDTAIWVRSDPGTGCLTKAKDCRMSGVSAHFTEAFQIDERSCRLGFLQGPTRGKGQGSRDRPVLTSPSPGGKGPVMRA